MFEETLPIGNIFIYLGTLGLRSCCLRSLTERQSLISGKKS